MYLHPLKHIDHALEGLIAVLLCWSFCMQLTEAYKSYNQFINLVTTNLFLLTDHLRTNSFGCKGGCLSGGAGAVGERSCGGQAKLSECGW